MNRIHFQLCTFGAILAVLLATPALAGGKKKAPAPERRPTTIASVSADSITIAESNLMKTFAITQFTEITVKGQRAKLADLQPGMSVSVTLGTDPSKLSRINAGDAPAGKGR